jgi:ankyrin repeat domain-containing protein 50
MLCNTDEGSIEEAQRILNLLCFSSRPLTVQELIDGIAVDLHEPACLNLRRRLQDADDLHKICPGLIDVDIKRDDETQFESDGDNNIEEMTPTVRIAHFSVQEYLEFDRIRH